MRPEPAKRRFASAVVDGAIAELVPKFTNADLATIFANCLPNTLDTTVYDITVRPTPRVAVDAQGQAQAVFEPGAYDRADERRLRQGRGTPAGSGVVAHAAATNMNDTFVITGDINAMWLRDSANQVRPYLQYAKSDPALQSLLAGLVVRQAKFVLIDPYANAFNFPGKPQCPNQDSTSKIGYAGTRVNSMTEQIFERKYELDSLVNFLSLSLSYYEATGDASPLGAEWGSAVAVALSTMRTMQSSTAEVAGNPPYLFQRAAQQPTDSLQFGVGAPAARTGMVRTAFRPSDDAHTLPFNIPGNAYAVSVLSQIAPVLRSLGFAEQAAEAEGLAGDIDQGIKAFGIMNHPTAGRIYAYEVDGYGNQYFMDDANLPSLLAMPHLGYGNATDPLYLATRKAVLSPANPYFFAGPAGEGTGGPHVGQDHIWPMSIIARGLTATDDDEISHCLDMLIKSTACKGLMHESFHVSSASSFTRPWFAWANSFFGEFILHIATTRPHLIF